MYLILNYFSSSKICLTRHSSLTITQLLVFEIIDENYDVVVLELWDIFLFRYVIYFENITKGKRYYSSPMCWA